MRAAVWCLARIPDSQLGPATGVVGALWHGLDRRHQRICRDNLTAAFPERSAAEIDQLTRDVFKHLAAVVLELCGHYRDGVDAWLERVDDPAFADGPPTGRAVYVAAHFGFWEFTPGAATRGGEQVLTVHRPFRNDLIDGFVRRARAGLGSETVPKKGALRPLLARLRAGRPIGLIIDQYGGRSGVDAPFFGRPALTVPSAAALALKMQAPVRPVGLIRTGVLRYRLVLLPELPPEGTVESLTVRINQSLETLVREAPEQWLWIHERWRRPSRLRPRPGAAAKPASVASSARTRSPTRYTARR